MADAIAATGCPTLQPILTQAQSFASASASAFAAAVAQSQACQQCLAGAAQAQATATSEVGFYVITLFQYLSMTFILLLAFKCFWVGAALLLRA